jgi:urate oxidase
MIELGENRYGKSAIRVVKLSKRADSHVVRDLTVAVALEGAFEAAHVEGDNAPVIATDTMKNTVYAFAADRLDGPIEQFGRSLAEHFAAAAQVERATITIREHRWSPITLDGEPAPDAFMRDPSMTRLAMVTAGGEGTTTEAGIEDMIVMKTAKSAFAGFPRDRFTTLPETSDRIMATQLSARWRYGMPDLNHDAVYDAIRRTLLDTFARHESESVQHSAWILGRAILEAHAEVKEVRLSLPNLHHWLVDLSPFGLANEGEIFVATREPHGLIEATVRRA